MFAPAGTGAAALASFAAELPADGKVTVNFKHAGDAPVLSKATYKLPATATMATVGAQLRKLLGLAPHDALVRARRRRRRRPSQSTPPSPCGARMRVSASTTVPVRLSVDLPQTRRPSLRARTAQFLYCSTAFAPPPDERLGDVAQCFQVRRAAFVPARRLARPACALPRLAPYRVRTSQGGSKELVLHYCTTPAWG